MRGKSWSADAAYLELVYLATALVPSREEEPDGGLELPGGDGGPLVVVV